MQCAWLWLGGIVVVMWLWCGCDVVVMWLWCSCDAVVMWLKCGCDVVMMWLWCGCDAVMMWLWCGCDAVVMRLWCGCDAVVTDVVVMRLRCGCDAVVMRLRCGCDATAMWLQCGCDGVVMWLWCGCDGFSVAMRLHGCAEVVIRDIHLRGSMWCRARVVGGHATIGRLSNNHFSTFQAIRNFFEKSRWTVTWQWSEVTRLSADCQTTIFRRFKQLEIFLKKVAERSRDSGRMSRDRRPTVKQRLLDVSSDLVKFWKKVAERSRDSGRTSRDRRTTVKQRFLDVSSDLGEFWKKSLNGHATVVGGHATVGWLSNNVFWTFQAIWENFEKSRWTVTRQWSEVTRPSADCQTTFSGRFKRFGKFLKKVAERSRDSGWGHATVGRLSNNVFWTFQAIWEFCEIGHWTVTRQWSEVTRPSADCQTTFFGRFKQLGNFL